MLRHGVQPACEQLRRLRLGLPVSEIPELNPQVHAVPFGETPRRDAHLSRLPALLTPVRSRSESSR